MHTLLQLQNIVRIVLAWRFLLLLLLLNLYRVTQIALSLPSFPFSHLNSIHSVSKWARV